MKVIYTIAFGAFLTIACSNNQPKQTNTENKSKNINSAQYLADTGREFKLVSAAEFGDRMKTQPGIVLDVRTPGEYKKGFIFLAIILMRN